ncbi:MAG TPA: glycosyltransferase family 2 protein [Verrucomicrobiae bacterium]|jgi:glycosyltransferase involved in cell wall biosynthesis|nr:glycosyltransferase family 2 protein [Verrucomicrobiae bacterium]
MAGSKPEISAIVVCFNEQGNIGRCLQSVSWCDEIVVVDAFSTDKTVEIARRYTDRVIQRRWTGYRDQKSFAHSQATREWVFLIDSDEEVSTELREEICDALPRAGGNEDAFALPRLVYYLGRWWRRGGWYPDYDIRIFRNDRARWGGTDPHEKILVDGAVRRLRHPLFHYSYRDVSDHWNRINRFTGIAAAEQGNANRPWRLSDNLLRPPFRFFRSYFLKRGFLEGFPGYFLAATAAMYVFLKYAKLRELELAQQVAHNGEEP